MGANSTMKVSLRIATACVAILFAPANAMAENLFTSLNVRPTRTNLGIELQSLAPLGTPRIRSEAGVVRVWFPNMGDYRLDGTIDDAPVQAISLRPGAKGTNVLKITLKDTTLLVPPAQVTVLTQRHSATVTLPLGTAAGHTDEPSQITPLETTSSSPSQRPLTPDQAQDTESGVEKTTRAGSALPSLKPSQAPMAPLGRAPSQESLGWLAGICVGLLVLLVVAKRIGRNRSHDRPSPIEIVAAKRMGQKHQLLVVRALGEDVLLSVQGDRTHRISATPTAISATVPGGESVEAHPTTHGQSDEPEPRGRKSRLGNAVQSLQNLRTPWRSADSDPEGVPTGDFGTQGNSLESGNIHTFSEELQRVVPDESEAQVAQLFAFPPRKRGNQDPPAHNLVSEENPPETVRGLIRLRKQAGQRVGTHQ